MLASIAKFTLNALFKNFVKSQGIKKFVIVAKKIYKYTKLPSTIFSPSFLERYIKYLPKKYALKKIHALFKKPKPQKEYLFKTKEELWQDFSSLDNNGKVKLIKQLKSDKADTLEEKKLKRESLNYTFWFRVKSPETGNFAALPQYANITKRTYGVPIRSGIFPNYIKYYVFNCGYNIIKQALETQNYGKEVYSKIRGVIPPKIKILLRDLVYNKK